MSFAWRSDRDGQPVSPSSPTSSQEEDDSEWNTRRRPHWPAYRTVFLRRGFRLDTVRDVKQYYRDFGIDVPQSIRTRLAHADDELCPDVGLVRAFPSRRVSRLHDTLQPDNLFRGTVVRDGSKFVVKAVHSRSRELDIIRYLSTPPVRDHPMNHCIRKCALCGILISTDLREHSCIGYNTHTTRPNRIHSYGTVVIRVHSSPSGRAIERNAAMH